MKTNKKTAGITIVMALFLNSCGTITDTPFTTNTGLNALESNFAVSGKKGPQGTEEDLSLQAAASEAEARAPKGNRPPPLNIEEIAELFPEVAEALKIFHETEKAAMDAKMAELTAAYPELATYLEENKPEQPEGEVAEDAPPPPLNMKEIEELFPEAAEALKALHETQKAARDAKMDELKTAYPDFAAYLEENKPPKKEAGKAEGEECKEDGRKPPKKEAGKKRPPQGEEGETSQVAEGEATQQTEQRGQRPPRRR